MPMVNPNFLRSLVAIADDGSFRAAARRLGLSQSGISMQVKSLERELAIELFDRASKPPRITLQGQAVVRQARVILAAYAEIDAIAQKQGPLAGALLFGVIPTASTRLMPDALLYLARDYPGIQIQLESGLSDELIERVRSGSLDGALVTEPETLAPTLLAQPIEEEFLVLVDAADGDRRLEFSALAEKPFIQFNRRAGVGQIIEKLLGSLGASPRVLMELDSIDAILTMVAKGLGISIIPQASILPHHARSIRRSPIDHPLAKRCVSLVARVDTQKQRLIDTLRDSLRRTSSQIMK